MFKKGEIRNRLFKGLLIVLSLGSYQEGTVIRKEIEKKDYLESP